MYGCQNGLAIFLMCTFKGFEIIILRTYLNTHNHVHDEVLITKGVLSVQPKCPQGQMGKNKCDV